MANRYRFHRLETLLGEDTKGMDLKVFGDTTGAYFMWDASADKVILDKADLAFGDTDYLFFGDANDVSLNWNATNLVMLPVADDTGAFHIGDGTTDFDVKVFLSASTKYVLFDVGGALLTLEDVDLHLGDNDALEFGDAATGDVRMVWNATNLVITPAVDDTGAINIGDGTTDIDLKWFGGTAAKFVLFDVGNVIVQFDDVDLKLGDNDILQFGDAAGGDVSAKWDATNLVILPAVDDTGAINIGDGTTDMDLKVFLSSTTNYVEFDVGNKLFKILNTQAGGDAPKAMLIDVDVLAGAGYRQGGLQVQIDRGVGENVVWDGNPDCGIKIIANNRAVNAANEGAVRAADFTARNRGTNVSWVNGLNVGARNDSGMTAYQVIGIQTRVENYGTLETEAIGLDINMSIESDTGAPAKHAIQVRNTDASGMTVVDSVMKVSNTSTNGFGALLNLEGLTAANGTITSTSGTAATTWAGRIRVIDAAGAAAWINLYSTSNEV